MSETSDRTALESRVASDRNELRTSRLADGNWLVAPRPNEPRPPTGRASDRSGDGDGEV